MTSESGVSGQRCRGRGLTLVELVVAVTLVAVAAAVAVPFMSRWGRDDSWERARRIAAVLDEGRALAASWGRPVAVAVQPETGAYLVLAGSSEVDTLSAGVLFGQDATGEGPWVMLHFDPFGRSRGGPIAFSDGARAYEIRVDPWTGDVTTRLR